VIELINTPIIFPINVAIVSALNCQPNIEIVTQHRELVVPLFCTIKEQPCSEKEQKNSTLQNNRLTGDQLAHVCC
jgi:hypothetical protein